MILIITDPIHDDYKSFYNLVCEDDWQKEFLSFRGMTVDDVKEYVNYWIENKENNFPQFLRMIKLTLDEHAVSYNELNSHLIGFVALNETEMGDRMLSGLHYSLSFGIGKKYYGKGIMTNALEMTIERLYDLGYNNIPAIVKETNKASEKVLQKCGFKLLRHESVLKSYVLKFQK